MNRYILKAAEDFVLYNSIIGLSTGSDPIKLKSGRLSRHYANWRTPASDVFLVDQATDFILMGMEDRGFGPECIHGVPEGATKTGLIAQYKRDDGSSVYRKPGSMLSRAALEDVACSVVEKTKSIRPTCFVSHPADSVLKELSLITQYESGRASKNYGKGSHPLVMVREKPKSHGKPEDRYFLGVPRGDVVLMIDGEWAQRTDFNDLKQIDFLGIWPENPPDVKVSGIVYSGDIPTVYPKGVEIFQMQRISEEKRNPSSVLLVEDVTTTGGSAFDEAHGCKEAGITVIGVFGMTNRNELTPIPRKDDPQIVEEFRKTFSLLSGVSYTCPMSVKQAFAVAGIPYYSFTESINILPRIAKRDTPDPEVLRFIENEYREHGAVQVKL